MAAPATNSTPPAAPPAENPPAANPPESKVWDIAKKVGIAVLAAFAIAAIIAICIFAPIVPAIIVTCVIAAAAIGIAVAILSSCGRVPVFVHHRSPRFYTPLHLTTPYRHHTPTLVIERPPAVHQIIAHHSPAVVSEIHTVPGGGHMRHGAVMTGDGRIHPGARRR